MRRAPRASGSRKTDVRERTSRAAAVASRGTHEEHVASGFAPGETSLLDGLFAAAAPAGTAGSMAPRVEVSCQRVSR